MFASNTCSQKSAESQKMQNFGSQKKSSGYNSDNSNFDKKSYDKNYDSKILLSVQSVTNNDYYRENYPVILQ